MTKLEYPLKIYVEDDYRWNTLLSHKNYNKKKLRIQMAQELIDEVSL